MKNNPIETFEKEKVKSFDLTLLCFFNFPC